MNKIKKPQQTVNKNVIDKYSKLFKPTEKIME